MMPDFQRILFACSEILRCRQHRVMRNYEEARSQELLGELDWWSDLQDALRVH